MHGLSRVLQEDDDLFPADGRAAFDRLTEDDMEAEVRGRGGWVECVFQNQFVCWSNDVLQFYHDSERKKEK